MLNFKSPSCKSFKVGIFRISQIIKLSRMTDFLSLSVALYNCKIIFIMTISKWTILNIRSDGC